MRGAHKLQTVLIFILRLPQSISVCKFDKKAFEKNNSIFYGERISQKIDWDMYGVNKKK